MKEYWLFTIRFENEILNCFFDWFPSKRDLKKASKGMEYAIIHTMQLTEDAHKTSAVRKTNAIGIGLVKRLRIADFNMPAITSQRSLLLRVVHIL